MNVKTIYIYIYLNLNAYVDIHVYIIFEQQVQTREAAVILNIMQNSHSELDNLPSHDTVG